MYPSSTYNYTENEYMTSSLTYYNIDVYEIRIKQLKIQCTTQKILFYMKQMGLKRKVT